MYSAIAQQNPVFRTRDRFRVQCSYRDHSGVTEADRRYMRRAMDLASRAIGRTFPNPIVGCVVVKNDQVIGEGFYPELGKSHAEVYALRAAGKEATGATAYVSLEPCDHYGKTPPCSLALLDAQIAKVVVGIVDPNPLVGGQGVKRLEEAGVDVVVGCLQQECYDMNKDFMERMIAS